MAEYTPTRPYLIRAIHEWAVENGFTPQILVSTTHKQVAVPPQHIKDNEIVLNLHPQSVSDLEMGNEYILCSARFSGKPFEITIPVVSVLSIYARENGQGIIFEEEKSPPPPPVKRKKTATKKSSGGAKKRAHLKLVK